MAKEETKSTSKGGAKAASKASAKSTKGSKGKQQADQHQGVGGKVSQFVEFFEESKVEMKKVTWPSRKETTATSIAVLVLVFVMSLFLGVIDLGLAKIVEFILS